MKFTIGKRIASGYILAIVALIALVVVVHRSTQALVQSNEFTNETFHLLIEMEDVLSNVKDAGLGMRGYIVSKDASFISRFDEATYAYQLALWQARAAGVGFLSNFRETTDAIAVLRTVFFLKYLGELNEDSNVQSTGMQMQALVLVEILVNGFV